MKRNVLILTGILALAVSLYAETLTTKAGLVKPDQGSTAWGLKTNANWDIVDSSFACLGTANTFAAANTFSVAPIYSFGTAGQILYPDTSKNVTSNSNLAWDVSNGAFVLGGGSGNPFSWMTVTAGGALFPIIITGAGDVSNIGRVSISGTYQVGYSAGNSTGSISTLITDNSQSQCNGARAGDGCVITRHSGTPPWARSSRLLLAADIEDDNSSTSVGPQIILSPKGAIVGPSDYPYTLAISTALAPLHVGYGTRNPNITNQKIVMDYPGDSKMVIIDSTTGHAGMFAVIASTIVYGSTSTANTQIWQNGVPAVTISSVGVSMDLGYVQFFPKTLAELIALTPTVVGQTYFCSNCVTDALCTSSGTARGAFTRVSARTTVCQ